MYVALRSIGQAGLHIQETCNVGWLQEVLRSTDAKLANRPSRVDAHIYRRGELLSAQGTFWLYVVVCCVRCAESVELCLTGQIDASLLPRPASHTRRSKTDSQVAEDDLLQPDCDMYYDVEGFSLEELLRPDILIELPTMPLCTQECKGLCGSCGENLNVEVCSCSEQQDRLEG